MKRPKHNDQDRDSFGLGFAAGVGLLGATVILVGALGAIAGKIGLVPEWNGTALILFSGWFQYVLILPFSAWSFRRGKERQAYGALTFSVLPLMFTTACGALLYNFSSGGPW